MEQATGSPAPRTGRIVNARYAANHIRSLNCGVRPDFGRLRYPDDQGMFAQGTARLLCNARTSPVTRWACIRYQHCQVASSLRLLVTSGPYPASTRGVKEGTPVVTKRHCSTIRRRDPPAGSRSASLNSAFSRHSICQKLGSAPTRSGSPANAPGEPPLVGRIARSCGSHQRVRTPPRAMA
jgi:hypothetical protein